jgi:hypothetical protein
MRKTVRLGGKVQDMLESKRIRRFLRAGLPMAFVALILIGAFQNCDGGFYFNPNTLELASNGNGSGNGPGSGLGGSAFRVTTYSPSGSVMAEGQSLDGGVEYRVVASGSSLTGATLMWQLSANTGACLLRSGTGPETRYLVCSSSGRVSVQVTAVLADGTLSVLVSERTTSEVVADLCGTSNTNRTVFRIPNGTGASAWNSAASPVVVFVGQTLRVCNDDSTNHQLRTSGNPCATQPAPMAKGQFYDCVVANRTGVNAGTGLFDGLYDNIVGANAAFYVRPYDGEALYLDTTKTSTRQSCNSCHNGSVANSVRGASFTAIRNAITSNRGNMGTLYNGRITDDELRAIAYYLNR